MSHKSDWQRVLKGLEGPAASAFEHLRKWEETCVQNMQSSKGSKLDLAVCKPLLQNVMPAIRSVKIVELSTHRARFKSESAVEYGENIIGPIEAGFGEALSEGLACVNPRLQELLDEVRDVDSSSSNQAVDGTPQSPAEAVNDLLGCTLATALATAYPRIEEMYAGRMPLVAYVQQTCGAAMDQLLFYTAQGSGVCLPQPLLDMLTHHIPIGIIGGECVVLAY